jgi:hypothetical protein
LFGGARNAYFFREASDETPIPWSDAGQPQCHWYLESASCFGDLGICYKRGFCHGEASFLHPGQRVKICSPLQKVNGSCERLLVVCPHGVVSSSEAFQKTPERHG